MTKTFNALSLRNATQGMTPIKAFTVVLGLLLGILWLPCQGQEDSVKNWHYILAPYIQFPKVEGDITLNGITIDATADAADIFRTLDYGAMLYFEASNDQWAILLDGYYTDFGIEDDTQFPNNTIIFDLKQTIATMAGLYRVASWAEVGLAARVNSMGSSIKTEEPEESLVDVDKSIRVSWIDPLIITRFLMRSVNGKWAFGLTSDFGGFGIGSKFAFQFYPFVSYRFTDLFALNLAYRWNSVNYTKGSGSEEFAYNIVISGPAVGLVFHL